MDTKADYFLSELLRALDDLDDVFFNRYAEALVKLAYRGRVPSEKPLPGGRTKSVAVMDGWRQEPLNALYFRKLSRGREGGIYAPIPEIGKDHWYFAVYAKDGHKLWERDLRA